MSVTLDATSVPHADVRRLDETRLRTALGQAGCCESDSRLSSTRRPSPWPPPSSRASTPAICSAARPCHSSSVWPRGNSTPASTDSMASCRRPASKPTTMFVPTVTVTGRSVELRTVRQGTPSQVVSSCTPPGIGHLHRGRQMELREEDRRHRGVMVLAGVHQYLLCSAPEGAHDVAALTKFGRGPTTCRILTTPACIPIPGVRDRGRTQPASVLSRKYAAQCAPPCR